MSARKDAFDLIAHFGIGYVIAVGCMFIVTPADRRVVVGLLSLAFWARENAQAVAVKDPDAWKPWRWSWHRHKEWLAGAAGAFTAWGVFASTDPAVAHG